MTDGFMASCEINEYGSCKIFSEDAYGPEFFKKLNNKLKREGVLDENLPFEKPQHFPGKCNTKSGRIISTAGYDFDRVVVVVDADDPNKRDDAYSQIEVHLVEEIKSKVYIIVLDYEIEEWICHSLEIDFRNEKPTEALDKWCRVNRGKGYKKDKWQLPSFVDYLDIEKLMAHTSFRDYIEAVGERV